jgi:hypothetical protein
MYHSIRALSSHLQWAAFCARWARSITYRGKLYGRWYRLGKPVTIYGVSSEVFDKVNVVQTLDVSVER